MIQIYTNTFIKFRFSAAGRGAVGTSAGKHSEVPDSSLHLQIQIKLTVAMQPVKNILYK